MATGEAAEAILWGVVGRLRAHGRHVSLREIQRAQDVIAYLVVRLGRPPTGEELRRHLQPIFCGRDRELATFAEVFRDSVPAPSAAEEPKPAGTPWRERIPRIPVVAAVTVGAALLAVFTWRWGLVRVPGTATNGGDPGDPSTSTDPRWTLQLWLSVAVLAAATAAAALLAFRKRLRRRPASPALEPDLNLGWETAHPLDPEDGVRVARVLRARTPEPGRGTVDVPRTIDATIRAGIRLTPCFVAYKRAPEYLAVIEQRSAGDVLAGHYARMVDQLSAQGVGMRRTGLQPRSQLVIDPVRGPRQLDSLQPASERERLLLFAPDWPLRDPLTGAERPWLDRFDLWAETIRIDPDVHRARPLRVVDRVLDDVRALDPAYARSRNAPAGPALPSVFETGDQLWIEAIPPPRDELVRVMELLVTTLGSSGWYWLSACAIYPEISYELTVALGRALHADDGRPLSEHLPLEVLARLPWFRHAYMPDWMRASLIGTLSRGQLVEARSALDRILTSGLGGAHPALTVTESVTEYDGGSPAAAGMTDRVYLEGTALRRRNLAAAAPKPLVAAIRRQRHRLSMPGLATDAPAARVRRALVASNALVAAAVLVMAVGSVLYYVQSLFVVDPDDPYDSWQDLWPTTVIFSSLVAIVAAAFSGALSVAAGRRRGVVLGSGVLILTMLAWPVSVTGSSSDPFAVFAVIGPVLALFWTAGALRWRFASTVVLWPRFQRRNRTVFAAGLGLGVLTATTFALAQREAGLLVTIMSDQMEALVFCLMFAALAAGLGAAYAGGVRVVPAAAGGVILVAVAIEMADTGSGSMSLLLAVLAVALVAYFGRQLHRYRDRPPPEFWETRWYEWKRPLMVGVPGVAGVAAWILSGGDSEAAFWFTVVPALFAVLNAAADRFGAFVAGNRLGVRFPLHLD